METSIFHHRSKLHPPFKLHPPPIVKHTCVSHHWITPRDTLVPIGSALVPGESLLFTIWQSMQTSELKAWDEVERRHSRMRKNKEGRDKVGVPGVSKVSVPG